MKGMVRMRNDLKIILLGTGNPRPSLIRSQAAQVIIANGEPILIDCGEGTTQQLMKAGIEPQTVKHLWFTHLHADHALGYGQFLLGGWGLGRTELTVYGPKGVKKFHERLLEMFAEDIQYKLEVGRKKEGLLDVKIIEIEEAGNVPCGFSAQVSADFMIHHITTLAYRFEFAQKAIVVSGDTAPNEKLVNLAKNADILIHDASLIKPASGVVSAVYENLKKEHCSPAQAGETAAKAGVKTLVLTHLYENADVEQAYREAAQAFAGEIVVGEDLLTILVR